MTTEFRQPTNIDNRRGAIRTSSKKISHRMETKKCFSCLQTHELTNCIYCGKVVCIQCIDDNACLVCHGTRDIIKLKKKRCNWFCWF